MPALAIVGGLVAGSLVEGRKARKSNEKASRIQQRSAKLQSGRQAVEQVRAAQVARAGIVQSAENQGVGGSSAALGGAGSVQSQAGGNIAFAQQLFTLQNSAARLQRNAAMHAGQSQALGTLASLGSGFIGGGDTPAATPPAGSV